MSISTFQSMLNSVLAFGKKERQDAVELGKMIPAYKLDTILLDTARTPHAQEPKTIAHGLFEVYGDFVAIESCDAESAVYFYPQFKQGEFNLTPSNRWDLRQYDELPFHGLHFYAFILEHGAESGKTLELSIGRESSFSPHPLKAIGLKDSQGTRIDPTKNPFRTYKYPIIYHGVMTVTATTSGSLEIDLAQIGYITRLGFEVSEWTEADTMNILLEKEDDTVLHIPVKLLAINGADRWHDIPLSLLEPWLNAVAGQNMQFDWAGTSNTLKARCIVEMMVATLVTS